MDEQRVREIVREELERAKKEEAAAGTTATVFGFRPFKAPGDTKPEGMVRKRGVADYFPAENT